MGTDCRSGSQILDVAISLLERRSVLEAQAAHSHMDSAPSEADAKLESQARSAKTVECCSSDLQLLVSDRQQGSGHNAELMY